jgi:uncharacterized cupin superfamily protein
VIILAMQRLQGFSFAARRPARQDAAMENVVNAADVAEEIWQNGPFWEQHFKPLTPALQPRMGRLGMNLTRVPPGKTSCPFHTHAIADEIFYVLSGRGVFRYGETLREVKAGDSISCPAHSGIAHQLANPFDEDFVFLAIGMNDQNEVCTYPDSGKVMLDALDQVGFLQAADYLAGEPEVPKIFGMISKP